MPIDTNATIMLGYYGCKVYNQSTQTYDFKALGKAVYLSALTENIDNGDVACVLNFDHFGKNKTVLIPHEELVDYSLLTKLSAKGAQVSKKNFNTFVDSLIIQEEELEQKGNLPEKVYQNLGWCSIPDPNSDDEEPKFLRHYRGYELMGDLDGYYIGDFKIKPMGTYEVWHDMTNKAIIGNIPMEVVLLASLSAIIVGIVNPSLGFGNPIFHLYGRSSSGKTTAAWAALSCYGEPYTGKKVALDPYGEQKEYRSLLRSWNTTSNALLANYAGNHGAVIVLDELGKYRGKIQDIGPVIYSLSDGDDKDRMTKELKTVASESYDTTFISAGEFSLLEHCSDKSEGLQNRVFEINKRFTRSGTEADYIKAVCSKNNGWAAPMVAQFILDNGGLKYAKAVYRKHQKALLAEFSGTPFVERYVSKFGAVLMATAEIAGAALDILFSTDEILAFLHEHEQEKGQDRATSANSYKLILEYFRINISNFYTDSNPLPKPCWGWYKEVSYQLSDGRNVAAEFNVRPSVVKKFLKDNGFPSKKICDQQWSDDGVISRDKDRPTRSRKPYAGAKDSEDMYVFLVFADPDKEAENNEPA